MTTAAGNCCKAVSTAEKAGLLASGKNHVYTKEYKVNICFNQCRSVTAPIRYGPVHHYATVQLRASSLISTTQLLTQLNITPINLGHALTLLPLTLLLHS